MGTETATPSLFALNAAKARALFDDLRAASDADAGELWGLPLYGPMVLLDQANRVVVANQRPPSVGLDEEDGVFVGDLPSDLPIANTAVEWDGLRWSMVMWPVPSDPEARLSLLVHEAWHRVQNGLGIPGPNALASHLEEPDARIALRLELRSLVDALQADSDEEARSRLARAVAYRQERRSAHPDGIASEDELEMNEGLAEYTGCKLGYSRPERAVAEAVQRAAPTTFVRSFAYSTGPAYGLLLDRLAPGWRSRVMRGVTLSELAAEAVSGAAPAQPDLAFRKHVEAAERRRAGDRAARNRRWVQLLVAGPTLRLPIGEIQVVFDPNSLVALGEHGTVYPSGQFSDRWGRVEVADWGALVDTDWKSISLSARPIEVTDGRVNGRGWELQLNPGWRVESTDWGYELVAG